MSRHILTREEQSRGGKNGKTRGSPKVNKMIRECLECDLVTAPGPLGLHQNRTRHVGWIDVNSKKD